MGRNRTYPSRRTRRSAAPLRVVVSQKEQQMTNGTLTDSKPKKASGPITDYILVIIAAIMLLMLFLLWWLPSYLFTRPFGPEVQTQASISSFVMAVTLFEETTGRLPENLSELSESKNNEPPYISGIPVDYWGNEFRYTIISTNGFSISSDGPDKQANTSDDILQTGPDG